MPLLALTLALAVQGASDPKMLETRIDAIVASVVGKRSPGCVVIVAQGSRTLYRKASGTMDLAGKTPLTPETPMKIASLTKALTATVIQGLATDDKMRLDDPIRSFFPNAPATWDGITVRNLLNHTSGIADYTEGMKATIATRAPKGSDEIVAWAVAATPGFAPGTKFEYSNTNYFLLSLIAERVGGAPLETQMATRIFGPLGMKSASLPHSGFAAVGEPQGTRLANGSLVPSGKIDLGWPSGAGAAVMSADDLMRWIGGVADAKALTEAQRAEAFTPAALRSGEPSFYGFGWILGTRGMAPLISHGGGINGFSSYVGYLPASDMRLVILANSEDANTPSLAAPILDAVEGKVRVVGIEDRDPKLTARLRGIVERMLAGERDPKEFDPAFLTVVPDDLWAKTGRGLGELGELEAFTLTKAESGEAGQIRVYSLSVGDATLTATFTLGKNGKISGLRLS